MDLYNVKIHMQIGLRATNLPALLYEHTVGGRQVEWRALPRSNGSLAGPEVVLNHWILAVLPAWLARKNCSCRVALYCK